MSGLTLQGPAQGWSARAIAFYLPQFHPIRENDEWWGKGFTEWTNVAKAKPLFRGHYQPHIPADLGFYDLRLPETREAQADLARQYGVEAFCYWHYWFGNGRRILERPFSEVLASGEPDFPFCLGWANESWSGIWYGDARRILIEQRYPGDDDYRRHFDFLLSAFADRRYVRVDGRPLLLIYKPSLVPSCSRLAELWRDLASRAGLPGLHIVGISYSDHWCGKAHGLDAVTLAPLPRCVALRPMLWQARLQQKTRGIRGVRRATQMLYRGPLRVYQYRDAYPEFLPQGSLADTHHPCVMPNWDNTPRSGCNGIVLHGSSPELFRLHLRQALAQIAHLKAQQRIFFIKSWNEWAEGNHLEPDIRFGHAYLQVLRQELTGMELGAQEMRRTLQGPRAFQGGSVGTRSCS